VVVYGPDVDNEVKIRWLDTGKKSSYINQDLILSNTLPDIEVFIHTATGCHQQLTVACLPQVTVVTPAGQRHAVRVPGNATMLAMQARVAEVCHEYASTRIYLLTQAHVGCRGLCRQ
jgi:hypothetical protein